MRLADKVSAKQSMIRLELWYSVRASGLDVQQLRSMAESSMLLPLDSFAQAPQGWDNLTLGGQVKTHEKETKPDDKGSAKARGGRGH